MVLSKNPKTRSAQVAGRMSMVRNIDKRLKNVEKEINTQEIKRFFSTIDEYGVTTSQISGIQAWLINNLSNGTGNEQLIGRQYQLTGLGFRMLCHNPATNARALVRCCIVRTSSDQTLGGSNGTDFFLHSSGGSETGLDFINASSYQRYYLPINHRKYDVVFQKTFQLGPNTSDGTPDANKIVSFWKKYKNRKETVDSNSNPNSRYYFIIWAIDPTFDNLTFDIEMTNRLKFYYKDN